MPGTHGGACLGETFSLAPTPGKRVGRQHRAGNRENDQRIDRALTRAPLRRAERAEPAPLAPLAYLPDLHGVGRNAA
eukprot:11155014-Lingulodinium_polyedra.AAC.1